MPRFSPNPNRVSSTFTTLPKDIYEFVVGEPKPYFQERANGTTTYGIRFPLTVQGGEYDGKLVTFNGEMYDQDNNETFGMPSTKRFAMACLGYPIDDEGEKRFNADTENEDWSFDPGQDDPDSRYVGEFWLKLKGCGVRSQLDHNVSKTDPTKIYHKFAAWYPMEG